MNEADGQQNLTVEAAPTALWRRLGWFIALWVGSVLSLGVVAYLIKLTLK
jgi:hypothetical protein